MSKKNSIEIDTNFAANTLIIPDNFNTKVLFSQTIDSVIRKDGLKFPAKGNHDMIAYVPIAGSSQHGWLFVSHETMDADSVLGDGGGATIFEVKISLADFLNLIFSLLKNLVLIIIC